MMQDYNPQMLNDAYAYPVNEYPDTDSRLSYISQMQFFWLCGLLLSFCYERPLVQITAMDRLNPRLFDIVFFVGLFFILPNLKERYPLPRPMKIWIGIVVVFGVCAVFWFPWFPFYYSKYTAFFFLKYLQGLIAIYIALQMPITERQKRILHYMVVIGGIVVATYAIPEYLRGGSRLTFAKGEKELEFTQGSFFSCLGLNYFHVAAFSALSSTMTLALINHAKNPTKAFYWFLLAAYVAWPAFFSGARAGIFLTVFGWGIVFLFSRATSKGMLLMAGIVSFGLVALAAPRFLSLDYLSQKSVAIKRLVTIEQQEGAGLGTISERLEVMRLRHWMLYKWQGIRLPIFGGGFYVAPHTYEDGQRKYRVGYGVHNSYLFAFEQGGLAAMILFIAFLVVTWRHLWFMRKHAATDPDKDFALGMLAYFTASLPVMMGGQIFWHGFGKVNFNSYLILLLVLGCSASYTFSNQWYGGYENDQQDYLPDDPMYPQYD